MSLFGNAEIEQLKEENQRLKDENQKLRSYVVKKEEELDQEEKRLAFRKETIEHEAGKAQQQIRTERNRLHNEYKQQQRENRGAINQKRRYLQKQQLISEYLEHSGWTIGEKPFTFELLTQMAKEWKQP